MSSATPSSAEPFEKRDYAVNRRLRGRASD